MKRLLRLRSFTRLPRLVRLSLHLLLDRRVSIETKVAALGAAPREVVREHAAVLHQRVW
jgi:hypothetical protein